MTWLKYLKVILKELKGILALVLILAFLIYQITSLVLAKDPTIYDIITSALAFGAFIFMLWLVIPGTKSQEKDLPPMLNCKITFLGDLKTDIKVLENTAKLMQAYVVNLNANPNVVIADVIRKDQQRKLSEKHITPTSETKWNDWVEREINTYPLFKRMSLRHKLKKIRTPAPGKPKKNNSSFIDTFKNFFSLQKKKSK
ncbi:hypothetical protein [Candidatus Villigracilis saccharophilus]|uniref:hypothetical protein n=1 Tax=Candidatus Villigracilis saccharophilus TaxID=3140684 RepID=UPI0031E8F602